jgi:sulfoxide reductase heme-binding subunit YedZ
MLFGLFVTARGLDGLVRRRVVLELHQQWALTAVIATALHVLTVVANAHSGVGVAGALVPFASARLTGAVAVGVVGAWGLTIIALSNWLRRLLPYAAWRAVHGLAFGVFALALVHSIAAGTDSGHPVVQWCYLGTSALVGGATLFRALVAIGSRGRRARTHAIERQDAHLAA